jgi:hypothetical protein
MRLHIHGLLGHFDDSAGFSAALTQLALLIRRTRRRGQVWIARYGCIVLCKISLGPRSMLDRSGSVDTKKSSNSMRAAQLFCHTSAPESPTPPSHPPSTTIYVPPNVLFLAHALWIGDRLHHVLGQPHCRLVCLNYQLDHKRHHRSLRPPRHLETLSTHCMPADLQPSASPASEMPLQCRQTSRNMSPLIRRICAKYGRGRC